MNPEEKSCKIRSFRNVEEAKFFLQFAEEQRVEYKYPKDMPIFNKKEQVEQVWRWRGHTEMKKLRSDEEQHMTVVSP